MPELADLCTWENLLERARISESGKIAHFYLKRGNVENTRFFSRMAAHEARLLFPELFVWESERYGQQLAITEAVA